MGGTAAAAFEAAALPQESPTTFWVWVPKPFHLIRGNGFTDRRSLGRSERILHKSLGIGSIHTLKDSITTTARVLDTPFKLSRQQELLVDSTMDHDCPAIVNLDEIGVLIIFSHITLSDSETHPPPLKTHLLPFSTSGLFCVLGAGDAPEQDII